MKRAYLDTVALVERLHRHFLEVVKSEIERLRVRDINNVQALILYNIGEDDLTVGELTQRGYYLGSNVSYNLK
ncbi:MAG: MarR family transcriptional regulator, partial [Alphaproteobacteria bacterium]|nr:MarR family transcriptional regulator [Alphaproteobacteria bacterium]